MEILDTYKELIETKSDKISICWKISQIFFYLMSAMSGYGSAILFYLLWVSWVNFSQHGFSSFFSFQFALYSWQNDIFADHCPLWAQIISPILPRIMSEDIPADEVVEGVAPDWRQKIIVTSQHPSRCDLYHFISLCSCVFGIIWLILFAMCGKGGYDTRMQVLTSIHYWIEITITKIYFR